MKAEDNWLTAERRILHRLGELVLERPVVPEPGEAVRRCGHESNAAADGRALIEVEGEEGGADEDHEERRHVPEDHGLGGDEAHDHERGARVAEVVAEHGAEARRVGDRDRTAHERHVCDDEEQPCEEHEDRELHIAERAGGFAGEELVGAAAMSAASAYTLPLKRILSGATCCTRRATAIAAAPISTDQSHPKIICAEMTNTNASETRRSPSTSTGTGRNSARKAREEDADADQFARRRTGLHDGVERRHHRRGGDDDRGGHKG